MTHVQIVRIMVNKTAEAAQTAKLHLLSIQSGTVNHY
jgi:hypothetical protein